jgi:hypothetical protein
MKASQSNRGLRKSRESTANIDLGEVDFLNDIRPDEIKK